MGAWVMMNIEQDWTVGVPQYGVLYVDDNDVIVYGPDRESREAAQATARFLGEEDGIKARVVKVSVVVEPADA